MTKFIGGLFWLANIKPWVLIELFCRCGAIAEIDPAISKLANKDVRNLEWRSLVLGNRNYFKLESYLQEIKPESVEKVRNFAFKGQFRGISEEVGSNRHFFENVLTSFTPAALAIYS